MRNGKSLTTFLLLCLLICTSISAIAMRTDTSIFDANKLLARTINIGYTIDDIGEPQAHLLTAIGLQKIKEAGFTAVRLPMRWVTGMAADSPYTIHPAYLKKVDGIIAKAISLNLAIIIDNHADDQLMSKPEAYKARFISLWDQLSEHYKAYPQQVMFELMAEPNGMLDRFWNSYLAEALTIVRKHNPTRPVIIGPGFYNNAQQIMQLELPDADRHIIVTFHQYAPLKIYHAGRAVVPDGQTERMAGHHLALTRR